MGLTGSLAEDHHSLTFCCFNPSMSLGGGAMASHPLLVACHPLLTTNNNNSNSVNIINNNNNNY